MAIEYLKGLGKLFVIIVLGFALSVLLYAAIRHNLERGIIIAIGGGLLIGIVTVLIGVFFDTIGRILVFVKYGVFRYNVKEERFLNLPLKHEDLLKKCEMTLRKLGGVRDVLVDETNNRVTAFCSRTWRSQGEEIEVLIGSHGNNSNICVQSRPLRKSVIFNGGKHFENVEMISQLLISDGAE